MAEAIITSFAQDILKNLLQILADETKLAWGYKGEVKRLEKRLEMTLAFLSDAESKSLSSETMKVWLKNLKGAVNDAAAVLDEFKYEALRQEIEVRGRFKNKVTDFFSSCNNPIAFRLKLAHKVKNVNLLLDDVKKEAIGIGLEEKIINAPSQPIDIPPRSTSPGVDIKSVVGREKDVSVIVERLLSFNNDEDLPVISICGMGGLGKTTLAHLVSMDERVAGHFNANFFIVVSTDFQVTRLLNQMLQSLTKKNQNLSNDAAIIETLSGELMGKRYLLILDDVWNTNPIEWNSLRAALLGLKGPMGGKVIVTCRDKKVAFTMGSYFTLDLRGLSFENSWTLFRHKAFANGGPIETVELVKIGKDIVDRCGGVPLAVEVLGSLMHSKKSRDEWLAVRENKTLSLEENLNFVYNILKFSYDQLSPSSLRSCFAFMSILPKDHNLEKDFFVQLWMALGLLAPPHKGNFLCEDVGNEYFDLLVGKSLLQEARTDAYGNIEDCRMHDLVHDLALRMSEGYCLTLFGTDEVRDIPDNVIHLSLISPTVRQIDQPSAYFKKIQTLIFQGSFPENIVIELKCLRTLVLKDNGTYELPPSIGKLKHLRFLDILETGIRILPSSITKLYNLQTLRVGYLIEIPKKFGNLINMRHFYGGGVLVGVGKLTSLQTLSHFDVSREQGCLVEELGGLTKLKGKLSLRDLDDIEDEEEAKRARLADKSRIQALEFLWGANREDGECNKHEAVLEGLRPHSELKSLKIRDFKGVKLSSWMTSESFIVLKNLVEIKLEGCNQCEQVPTLGHLPNLKKVVMERLKKVRKIGQEFYYHHNEGDTKDQKMESYFPALKELVLGSLTMLEEWMDVKQVYQSSSLVASKIFQFPNLEKLEIWLCENLEVVPSQFPSLKELKLSSSGNSRLELQKMSSGLTCLTHLRLRRVKCELGSVLEELFKNNSKSLTYVSIDWCDQSIELPNSLLKDCVALKTLHIDSCKNIKVIPDVGGLTSLMDLDIRHCRVLKGLPRGIETLTSLQRLFIYHCPQMTSLPDLGNLTRLEDLEIRLLSSVNEIPRLPTSLKKLEIWDMEGLKALPDCLLNLSSLQTLSINNCPSLKERCVKGSGTDWHKIQHIPFIYIK